MPRCRRVAYSDYVFGYFLAYPIGYAVQSHDAENTPLFVDSAVSVG